MCLLIAGECTDVDHPYCLLSVAMESGRAKTEWSICQVKPKPVSLRIWNRFRQMDHALSNRYHIQAKKKVRQLSGQFVIHGSTRRALPKLIVHVLALGLTPGPKFTKRGADIVTFYPPSSTILPNFIALRQPTPEIPITKYLRTSKHRNSNY